MKALSALLIMMEEAFGLHEKKDHRYMSLRKLSPDFTERFKKVHAAADDLYAKKDELDIIEHNIRITRDTLWHDVKKAYGLYGEHKLNVTRDLTTVRRIYEVGVDKLPPEEDLDPPGNDDEHMVRGKDCMDCKKDCPLAGTAE